MAHPGPTADPAPYEPTEGEIRLRAYRIWQWLGAPEGYEDEIWARAERELREEAAKARDGRREA